ncbi:DUF305 domain-containing protein [Flavilitoribacter nigricans]|uniref:DUF305 domain-containing protein n=1 Tax=Flavilitoribacter nigricans (strain ATCC 23147 / DSM 23189 / NBRC 102662 / NCIMB 1420 / SS-2) TaxID=1122177 RepID=A0A2D0N0E7_FLAN2|nr:DUF305 domain-containing protein [Flavilitoribacter nigricans]PHN01900.1 DUF305 domain-containing protein [Flavilitoribacter nigricans DSM 23189 = NBRC 102662]
MNPYVKFGLMMLTSFVIMYAVMYMNVDQLDHIYLAQTRTYMTILMIAPMAITMLLFMWGMYKDKRKNYLILGAALLVGAFTYHILRQQTFVDDKAWMRAMIPHHSSAIMVSEKAQLDDPEAIQLAKEIIEAQKREIAQMKKMLYRLEQAE